MTTNSNLSCTLLKYSLWVILLFYLLQTASVKNLKEIHIVRKGNGPYSYVAFIKMLMNIKILSCLYDLVEK